MATTLYRDDLNKGLATSFQMVDGKPVLTGGQAKAEDNLLMLLAFLPWFRVFFPDFIPDVLWAYQRNTSVVVRFKNLLRLRVLRATLKYCPFVEVRSVDIPLDPASRRSLVVDVAFRYKLAEETQFQSVRFLTKNGTL